MNLLFVLLLGSLVHLTAIAQDDWAVEAQYQFVEPQNCPVAEGQIYPVCEDQTVIFNNALERARLENKKLLIKFGATWCLWCQSLHQMIPELFGEDDEIARRFVFVEIATSSWDDNGVFRIPTGVFVLMSLQRLSSNSMKVQGVPFLAIADPSDRSSTIFCNTGELEDNTNGRGHSKALVSDAIKREFKVSQCEYKEGSL